jgi:hypothetical protein
VGSSQSNQKITNLFLAANRDPRMHHCYKKHLNAWKDSGASVFVHFNHINPYSQWGSWGAMEFLGQKATKMPKMQALLEYLKNNPMGTSYITLEGKGRDSDGSIQSYLWTQISGNTVALNGANTKKATFIAPTITSSTNLTFKLTVTDDLGAKTSDEITITINP